MEWKPVLLPVNSGFTLVRMGMSALPARPGVAPEFQCPLVRSQ